MPVPSFWRTVVYILLIIFALIIRYCIRKYRLLPTVLVLSIVMQGVAFVSVPTFVLIMRWRNSKKQTKTEPAFQRDVSLPSPPRLVTVLAFVGTCAFEYIIMRAVDETDIWLVAAGMQGVAYAVVALKVAISQSVAGMSAGKFMIDALSLVCRIAATWSTDYRLPRNSGNDFVKSVDIASLVLAIFVLVAVHVLFRHTYQAESDTFRILEWVAGCAVLALLLHVDIGHSFVFDSLWTFAMYLDVVSMLPQLQMIGQNGGVVDKATSHHIAMLCGSRLLGFTFWWMIQGHWFQGLSWTGWGIMTCWFSQVLLLSSFMCYYFKGLWVNGIFSFAPLLCSDS